MIVPLMILFGILITVNASLIVTQTVEDSRIDNWAFIIDLLFKTGYKPKTISKILDYYTI